MLGLEWEIMEDSGQGLQKIYEHNGFNFLETLGYGKLDLRGSEENPCVYWCFVAGGLRESKSLIVTA